ncbi:MAG: sortase [Clostridia bacterium]|nr:sortase [Clostridia bacterium]
MRECERKKDKVFINIMLVATILGVMAWLGIEKYKEDKIEDEKGGLNYIAQSMSIAPGEVVEEKVYPKEDVEKEYRGYLVEARLEIPSIDLETYVLKDYSVQALNVTVTKFWGAGANQEGNCCIAGHNFQNKNMFRNLKKLKLGDRLFVTDNDVGKVEYEVYDIFQVLPKDVSCLSQDTDGKRVVTLITCTNDSKKRIIVKASELESSMR